MENKLYVSPSPHIHGGDSISKNMYGVLIALVPAFLVSLYFFGLGALIVTVASVFFCVLFEYLIQKFLMKKEPTIYDGSAILTGVLLAFNLPSNLPIWIIAIGALAAYISDPSVGAFQPMNVNFGIITPLGYKVKGKRNKNAELSKRALELLDGLDWR